MVVCSRCFTAVYAAEQTVGPGRKIYHKTCLKCKHCNKRLDSNLVEHDEEPYCKSCHTKLFGTRDLRSHNHYVPPPVSPTQPDRPPPPPTTYLPKPSLPTTPKPSFSPRSTLTPGLAGRSNSSAGISHPPSSPARVSIAPVGVRSASSLAVGGGRGAGVWRAESVTPRCPACENPVYFAEQVIALDRKWHKACLRCSACKNALTQSKVLEHDGHILCGKCHSQSGGAGFVLR